MELGAAAAPAASWSRPFALSAAQPGDLGAPQLAFGPDGRAAIALEVQPEDDPSASRAFLVLRSARGQVSRPRRVPGAQQVLALAFAGSSPELLTGTAAGGRSCCDSAGLVAFSRGGFGRRRRLAWRLSGAALGAMAAPLSGGLVAAVATGRGVWVTSSARRGRFSPPRRVSAIGQQPWSVAVAAPASGGSIVAWTATTGAPGVQGPTGIFAASGSALRGPHGRRLVMRVPPGHQIDELALAPGRASATAAFVENWFDRSGGFHSQAVVADLGSRPARSLPSGGQLASDVQIAGNRRGDQVVAWKACDTTPDCSVWAALRQGGGRFGRAIQLGPTDADQDPVVAISPSGLAIVSWIGSGRVVAAWGSVSGGRLTGPRMLSSTGDESAPALGFSPTGQALAVWVQGTVAPQLMGALFR